MIRTNRGWRQSIQYHIISIQRICVTSTGFSVESYTFCQIKWVNYSKLSSCIHFSIGVFKEWLMHWKNKPSKNHHDSCKSKTCLPNLSFLESVNEDKRVILYDWTFFLKKKVDKVLGHWLSSVMWNKKIRALIDQQLF